MKLLKSLTSIKRLSIFLLLLLVAVVIVACDTGNTVPYGSLGDDTYLEIDTYKVTEKELYNHLRVSSLNRFVTFVDEIVFKNEVDALNPLLLTDFQVEAFEKEINTALFSSATTTPVTIAAMSERNRAQRILSFADSFAITNPGVDKEDLIDFLEDVVEAVVVRASDPDYDVEEDDEPYGYLNRAAAPDVVDAIIAQYELAVAKKQYAKDLLGYVNDEGQIVDKDGNVSTKEDSKVELTDEDSTVFIKEENIVSQYKSAIAGKYDISAVIIKFSSVKEHEIARYKYSIKSNSRGEWYYIPNIALQAVIDVLNAGDTDPLWNATYQKALDILVKPTSEGGLGKVQGSLTPIDYRTSEFATYYSKYTLNNSVDTPLDDSANNNEVLWTFLKIYDDLNGTNFTPADIADLATGEAVRTALEANDAFSLAYTDRVLSSNTSLRTYVYGLDKESLWYQGSDDNDTPADTSDDTKYSRPYSRQVQTFGSSPYLVYLMNDERESDEDVLDETNPDEIVFMDNANAQAVRTEALKDLVEARLTDAYVTSKVSEKYEEDTIDIYDPVIREFYDKNYDYSGSTGFLNNNVVAKVHGTEFTVDAFFEKLQSTLGLSTALDLVLMQKLRVEYGADITEEDKEDFKKEFKTQYVDPFTANNYESAGFPASLGLEKFLLLGFGAYAHDGRSATEDAIDKVYVQAKLRELFEADLESHYDGNIYEKFATLAERFYDNSVGFTASHLLVYLDLNADGNPDDPNDINFADANLVAPDTTPITNIAELEAVIADFVTLISDRAKLKSTMAEGLNAVVSAYADATRYELTYNILDPYREDVWVPYKKLGFQLKYESLGEITNQKNFPSNSSQFDVDFFDYAYAIASYLKDEIEFYDVDGTLTPGDDSDDVAPTLEEKTSRANAMLPLYAPDLGSATNPRANYSVANTRSGFGWHLILATGYTQSSSAEVKLDADPDTDPEGYAEELKDYTSEVKNPFDEDEFLNAVNANPTLSWQQIVIYIEESSEETGVVTLPTAVQTAVTKYFTPVQTAYNNSYSQLELAFKYVLGENMTVGDAALDAKLAVLRAANFNQFYGYSYFEGIDGTGNTIYDRAFNPEYAAIYAGWFDVLNA